jgi:murein DD-endopeptidase MepM/ murein hydrolase activator NlpD
MSPEPEIPLFKRKTHSIACRGRRPVRPATKWLGRASTVLAVLWVVASSCLTKAKTYLVDHLQKLRGEIVKASILKITSTSLTEYLAAFLAFCSFISRKVKNAMTGMLKNKRAKIAVVAVPACGIVLAMAFLLPEYLAPALCQITVDGEPVAFAENEALAEEALDAVFNLKCRQVGLQLEITNDVHIATVKVRGQEPIKDQRELTRILSNALSFRTTGYCVNVSGRDIGYLATKEQAEGVLEGLKSMYVQAATRGEGVKVKNVTIRQDISIRETRVDPGVIRDSEIVKRILLRGTDRVRTHKVSRGESLWTIASRNRVSVDELRQANPELEGDFLQIGQDLNLVVSEPLITVETVEEREAEFTIPRPVRYVKDKNLWSWETVTKEKGKDGKKKVVFEITRENGIETSRETISEEIIEEPVERVVAKGTREAPTMGTGKLVWPVRGTITSRFGPRGRGYHQGIDIGASSGTPIHAADSGTVTFSGYSGGYGRVVFINHGGGMVTVYGHNSANLVSAGEKVKKGQIIARVGRTGRATGNHVHFEVRLNGRAVDPVKLYK